MKTGTAPPRNVDKYIAGFPADVQAILKRIRATIRKAAPAAAEERISYQIPAFLLAGKPLVFFAAYKKHIGLYPAPRGAEQFKQELSAYAGGKGTVQFPLDKPIPLDLIRRIVKFSAKTILEKTAAKAKQK